VSAALLLAQNAGQDIRDIRGPIALPELLPWLLAGAIALAVALLVLGVIKFVRARRRRPLSPYRAAALRLRELANTSAALPPDQLAEQLSGALRAYVEQRFGLRASKRTSEDFLAELCRAEHAKLAAFRPELERFLGACDLAKFAGRRLTDEQRVALCADALRFVEAAEASFNQPASEVPLEGAIA
jgi:hypothetical protein